MGPIDKFNSFGWINVFLLNMLIQVIWTLVYVVESKIRIFQGVNPVQTHYVVYELKNTVKLIEHIDKSGT